MGAVAYTSSKATKDFYYSELAREKREIKEVPDVERQEIRDIYRAKGFKGKLLEDIVKQITSKEETWLNVMMSEELGLTESKDVEPVKEAVVVGISSLIGSLIPLIPFLLLPVSQAITAAIVISIITLFAAGALGAKLTIGDWKKKGLQMAAVGTLAALAGFAIGSLFGARV